MTNQRKLKLKQEFIRKLFFSYLFFVCWLFVYEDYKFCKRVGVRKAAKLINDKVLQYKQKYTDKDTQDFLAMAALQYVSKVLELEGKQDSKPIINELQEIEKELEDYLQKQ